MDEASVSPRRPRRLYAALVGILAAALPCYCTAAVLISIHPSPTVELTPSAATRPTSTRRPPPPLATTAAPPAASATLTGTQFIPPSLTITPTSTATSTQPPPPPPTRTPSPTPPPTPTPTQLPPTDTPAT